MLLKAFLIYLLFILLYATCVITLDEIWHKISPGLVVFSSSYQ
jgi:Fe2+ transport system protein B